MAQATKTRVKKSTVIKYSVTAAIPLMAVGLYYVLASKREWANGAVKHFSRPVRDFLGTACGFIPFSVMELMYTALGIFAIVFIVRTVVKVKKSDKKFKMLLKRVFILAMVVLYIFGAYLMLWGIDYQSDSFSAKAGFYVSGVSTEDLYDAAKFFITNAVALADSVPRDENGEFSSVPDEYFPLSATVYDVLEERFPCIDAETRTPKKMLLYSKVMSYMGFTGIYFPFTGESNINIDPPNAFTPLTVAHELAHQRGIYSEQECNFLGVAACVTSDIDLYRYSGYLGGSLYLMNALYSADRELWRELRPMIIGGMLADWEANDEYWDAFESPVSDVSSAVYDTYLKANGQDMGMRSYGACVNHLVAYYVLGGFTG